VVKSRTIRCAVLGGGWLVSSSCVLASGERDPSVNWIVVLVGPTISQEAAPAENRTPVPRSSGPYLNHYIE
jgi:hypothetical protein